MTILTDKRILLGVTGSIAAYKAVELASQLTQAGAQVDVLLTPAAEKFVSALTFQSVTGRPALCDTDLWGGQAHVLHVGLAQSADLLVIAPCTANTLAKLVHGLADNLLTITALAARCPLLLAPAMDVGIYSHPATQASLAVLSGRGVHFAGPAQGRMASGLTGLGRLLEPVELLGRIRQVLGLRGSLAGRKIVVSAGGAREPLDPVRVLTNRSSGKQGYAIAQAAIDAGASVVLISSAPAALPVPVGASLLSVETADEMLAAVLSQAPGADALIMAAAVADFRPAQAAGDKLKKRDGLPQVQFEFTPDILAAVAGPGARRPRCVIGFAAESSDLLENAAAKLKAKNLDLIVANDISASDSGFNVQTNRVTLLFADGRQEALPLLGKDEVAETLIARLAVLLETQ